MKIEDIKIGDYIFVCHQDFNGKREGVVRAIDKGLANPIGYGGSDTYEFVTNLESITKICTRETHPEYYL